MKSIATKASYLLLAVLAPALAHASTEIEYRPVNPTQMKSQQAQITKDTEVKKLAPIALGLALSQAAGAQTTIAKLTLGGEAQNVQIQYARWAMKYPVAKKQVPCSPADEEGSFTAPCYATAQTAPRLVVTVRYSERPSDEETTYKDIVINPKDLSPSNDRLEKLFKVDVRKVSAVVPVERLVCLGEGTDSSCEKETHMAKVTRTLVDVIRR